MEWLGRYAQLRGIGPICPGRGGGCMGTTHYRVCVLIVIIECVLLRVIIECVLVRDIIECVLQVRYRSESYCNVYV